MKLTRRDFATLLAPAAALAGTSAAQPQDAALLEAARARIKENGAILAERAVPMDTAPAFQFKA